MRAILDGNALPLRDALPGAARNTAMSPDGRFLVMMHPRADVWDVANMRAVIDDMRSVDPDATGAPFTHYESLRDMRSAFLRMATLSVILVALLVLLDFKRPMDVLLAMLPLMLAMLWTFELMGIFHVSFNLANFFAVPILIGLGVDSSIHLLHRYHEGGADRLDPGSTRRAVILTNLTTTIGFAPLVFADHLGMRSLGLVMILGNTACLVAVLIVLPATLALRERLRRHRSIPDHHMA
jgi:predicted RND superfamily exporter protein